ncbi:MAG: response regulator [Candidatus Thiodiazotropha sp.]|nr:response regulator [Candidatus Thiodiazotropha sp.]MCM8881920.1 response regulator [Candidatus Thiodiazotropha sp.]MCM8918587.1 response regulator [Candidatus Thiodiazotropha sp.]
MTAANEHFVSLEKSLECPVATVLIVDDDPENLEVMRTIFRDTSCRIKTSVSAEMALQDIEKELPDLMLIDTRMPGMDGYELCRCLKAKERTRHFPVLFISPTDLPHDKLRAFEVGALDFITKPYQEEELLVRVRTHLLLYCFYHGILNRNVQLAQARDVLTERLDTLSRTQSLLIESEKMAAAGRLLAGVSHEIRNPLNFICTLADLSVNLLEEMDEALSGRAQDGPFLPPPIDAMRMLSHNCDEISNNCRRAAGVVDTMLEHSVRNRESVQQTDINHVLELAVQQTWSDSSHVDESAVFVELNQHLNNDLPKLSLNRDSLLQVLKNILHNAFDAMTEKQETIGVQYRPQLTLSTLVQDPWVEIRIHDNGIGMDSTLTKRVFEPFLTTKAPDRGKGVGLSLAYEMVQKDLNGEILVESESGEYAEFVVRLPLAEPETLLH